MSEKELKDLILDMSERFATYVCNEAALDEAIVEVLDDRLEQDGIELSSLDRKRLEYGVQYVTYGTLYRTFHYGEFDMERMMRKIKQQETT